MKAILFVFLLTNFVLSSYGANILGIFTSYSPSHNIIHMSEVDALIQKGHNVTVITALPLKQKNPKYHHVYIPPAPQVQKLLEDTMEQISNAKGLENMKIMVIMMKAMINLQYDIMFTDQFQNVIHGDTKYDLVLLGYVMNDFYLAAAYQMKVPVVVSWVNFPMSAVNTLVGNPNAISYVPHPMISNVQPMGFINRFKTFILSTFMYGVEKFMHYKLEQYYEEYKDIMKLSELPEYQELQRNISLVIGNSHFSDGVIRANVPAYVEVGGIQVKPEQNPLDNDLKEFLDNSSAQGAIFFSMGSNIKVSSLDPKVVEVFYNVLSKVNQNVVWKWEDPSNVPGNSKNIFYRNWLPQDDILAHKNVKLFVTHGGKGSIVESQYHGVPMIGLPVFGDQPGNAKLMVDDGYGLLLDYQTMSEEDFRNSIEEVLSNRTYTDNIQRFSKVYRDRPMSARDTAVYWIEYVMRHHGALHMQSPLVHSNIFVQYSLDVVGFLFLVIFIFVKIVKLCFSCAFKKRVCKTKVKKN
ncbi:hypothetical protein ACFFRR_000595 [Megaselia abdita]